jgi:RNA polymerase sigma-70 factor (ECF subfamily)
MPSSESINSQSHEDFLRLFTASEPTLRAYIRRLVPTQNDASEISQNTSIVLWQKFGVFLKKHPDYNSAEQSKEDIQLHFKRWAMVVARYEVLSWRRDKYRDRHVFSEDLMKKLAIESQEQGSMLENQLMALESCLKKIPEERRNLVLEAYSARNKPQEIATRRGGTLNGFYQWLHRIRLSLLKCVKQTLATEAYQ